MPNYNLGCIYKIKHNEDYDDENIYIGSTCNLIRRRCQHKTAFYNENDPNHNLPLYQYIRENGRWDNWIMIKIHDYNCNSKSELEIEERRMIDLLKPKLNKYIPTRSLKEWHQDNKEVLAEKRKGYREANREVIAEKDKKRYQVNKQVILEKRKEYYEENKGHILEKQKEKCKCDNCGVEITKKLLQRHKKSQKCLSVKNNICTN
jgi:hypothetical protein